MLNIKVLGPGCANCAKVEQITRKVLAMLGEHADIQKVTAYPEMQKYHIHATPGLVVNEKLVCAGRIPTEGEVTTWIVNELAAAG